MTAQQLPCPTCGRLTPISSAKHLPFCSDRCRLVDLGRWLDEEHAVPVAPTDDEEASEASSAKPNSTDSNTPASKPGKSAGKKTSGSEYLEEPERRPVRLPPGWHDA